MTKALTLPRREYEDAGKVVVIPRELLFAEEADDLRHGWLGSGVGVDEQIIEERAHVEEDGFGVEEEFGEEREILSE